MKIRFFALLIVAIFMFSSPMINAMEVEEIIKIQTSDKRVFYVPKSSIKHLVTVKHMIEDLSSIPDIPIPIANVDGDTFEIIKKILESKNMRQYFIDNYYDDKTLVKLINAENYLDFGILLDALTSVFASKINKIDSKNNFTKKYKKINNYLIIFLNKLLKT